MATTRRDRPWTAEHETRLIEMVRTQHTLEEIARELSMPVDEIQVHIDELDLEGDNPYGYD